MPLRAAGLGLCVGNVVPVRAMVLEAAGVSAGARKALRGRFAQQLPNRL